jgi:hypothetical protein
MNLNVINYENTLQEDNKVFLEKLKIEKSKDLELLL